MNRKILQLAIPSIISNITVPLLGLVDMAIVGHLGSAVYIGAIAVGGMLFNMIYWLFGFLRMGTSGITSQAFGRRDLREAFLALIRSVGVGLSVALLLLLLSPAIRWIAFRLMDTTAEVESAASLYFSIGVWGAPAVLSLYGFMGWFIGMQNSRFPMFIAIVQNLVNILVSLFLVYGLKMRVEGVALGTVIAQYASLFMAIGLVWRFYGRLWFRFSWRKVMARSAMERFFSVNKDIFFRTLCLVCVTTFFTSIGARQGDLILAVNTLIMQLFTLFSYVMDGFAYAAEALTGRFIGAGNPLALRRCVRALFIWGILFASLFTLVYGLWGNSFLGLLTNERQVVEAAGDYWFWALAIPVCGFSAFLWDGVFIGATATRQMLYAMLVASLLFFSLYYCLTGHLGNHALWFAFLVYLFSRGGVQWWLWRRGHVVVLEGSPKG